MDLSIFLVALIVAVIINLLLGVLVIHNNPRSATNIIYGLLSIVLSLWLVIIYVSIDPDFLSNSLLWIRLSLFFATPMTALFFLFSFTMPGKRMSFKKRNSVILFLATGFVMLVTVSHFAFTDVRIIDNSPQPTPGPGLFIFGIFVLITISSAIYRLIKKIRTSEGIEKQQFIFVAAGIVLMFSLLVLTILIPVALFKINFFVPFAPIYTLIFLGLTAYAVVKHHLFDVKVIATEALVITIWLVLFARIFISRSLGVRIIDTIIFFATIPFGIFLVRSVIREIKIARQQYEMVATVSHQLRTPLTPVIGLASMLVDGDFKGPAEHQDAEKRILKASQRLRNVINDFLEMFELEGDSRKRELAPMDVEATLKETMKGLEDRYKDQGLYLRYRNPKKIKPKIQGEARLFTQAISNLLDNAEKYTPKGGTTVTLEPGRGAKFVVKVQDTGIGLDGDDKQQLFQKFYRSEAARKIRPDGSGLGLPIVRQILESHGGKITADSPGRNKGTTFTIIFH